MSTQHLSDEAVAAFADGVLSGHARERAGRHASKCPECAYAVAVQREAVWALRAAPAPSLPIGMLERLRSVPTTTPIEHVPAALGPDGSAMFAAFGTMMMPSAALVASSGKKPALRTNRVRPIAMTAAAVATAGVLAVASGARATASYPGPARPGTGAAPLHRNTAR